MHFRIAFSFSVCKELPTTPQVLTDEQNCHFWSEVVVLEDTFFVVKRFCWRDVTYSSPLSVVPSDSLSNKTWDLSKTFQRCWQQQLLIKSCVSGGQVKKQNHLTQTDPFVMEITHLILMIVFRPRTNVATLEHIFSISEMRKYFYRQPSFLPHAKSNFQADPP